MRNIFLILLCLSVSSLFADKTTSSDDARGEENPKKYRGYLDLKMSETVLTVGGRVQLDASSSWPDGSATAAKAPLTSEGENGQFNSSVKDSRVWIKTVTPTKIGIVRSIIETDFLGNIGGNERNTNNQSFRLRHAFVEVNNIGFGQTNSLFNTFVTPDTIAIPISDTLVRQPQVRYTINGKDYGFDFSLEQPESTFLDESSAIIEPKDDVFPDFVSRVRYYPEWGQAAVSVLLRYLNQDEAVLSDEELTNQDSALAWGINTSMKYNINESDDIRLGVQYGDGMGRYIAYDAFGAGTLDKNGNISTHVTYGFNMSYLHWYNKEFRSTLAVTHAGVDNDKLLMDKEVNKEATSTHINLIYTPLTNLMYGVEYMGVKRVLENGVEGDMHIAMFRARYDF